VHGLSRPVADEQDSAQDGCSDCGEQGPCRGGQPARTAVLAKLEYVVRHFGHQACQISCHSTIRQHAGVRAERLRPHTGDVRITIRVRPGSARPGFGGEHDGALVVRVSARAVGGKATEAALAAVAEAFGVRRQAVTLVTGASSRTKIVDVAGADPAVLARLLAGPLL